MFSRDPVVGMNVKFSDFEVINLIGQGSISNVYLVLRKSTEEVFAMKCIQKGTVLADDLFVNTKLEKDLLITVSSHENLNSICS